MQDCHMTRRLRLFYSNRGVAGLDATPHMFSLTVIGARHGT